MAAPVFPAAGRRAQPVRAMFVPISLSIDCRCLVGANVTARIIRFNPQLQFNAAALHCGRAGRGQAPHSALLFGAQFVSPKGRAVDLSVHRSTGSGFSAGRPVSRVLFRTLRSGDGHFSRPTVARRLERPTRGS